MGIANIINVTGSAGGGEIIRELVNASDGQGLHFAAGGCINLANSAGGEFGLADFSIEFILDQDGDNVSNNYIWESHNAGNNRVRVWNELSSNVVSVRFVNSAGANTTFTLGYDMSADYGKPTHYAITCDRDGNATLYKNGNNVASVSISSTAAFDLGDSNTNTGIISNSSNNYSMLGTFYRFRTWNKALTAAEVTATYENATVPFADQYGSQTELVVNGSFAADTNWTKQSGWTISGGVANCETSDDYALYQSANNQTVGKKYRITFTISNFASGGVTVEDDYGAGKTLYAANGTHTEVYTATTTATRFFGKNGATTSLDIDNVSVVAIGAVTDYDLAFANPTQSLMVQDRAGVADGTASASGVSQTQKIVQLNSTSIAAGAGPVTPADNTIHLKAADGAYGIIHENASGVKVATYTGGSSAFIGTQGAHQMSIATGGSERLKIDSAGLVTVDGGDLKIKSPTGSQQESELLFESTNASGFGATYAIDSKIISHAADSGNAYGSKLKFYTNSNANSLTQQLVIDNTGLATFTNGITLSGGFTTLGSFSELTIASGAVTATSSVHNIETEGAGATDYLDTINGGSTGTVLTLMAAHSSRTVVVEDGTNLKLAGDCTLDNIEDTITLIKNGSAWHEVSRSNNGA